MSIPRIPEGKGWIDQLLQHCDGSKAVQVYKNLHKDCWSVRQSGKVVAHMDYICLKHCSFKVSEKGRDRVRKEGSKNVHAYIRGFIPKSGNDITKWENFLEKEDYVAHEITYNPYENDTFVSLEDDTDVTVSPMVDLDSCELFGNVMAWL